MKEKQKMSNNPLAPIAPHLMTSEPTKFILKEKVASLSGDSAKVMDESGSVIFTIDAKLMSISERRRLLNSDGKEIAQLRRKRSPGLHSMVYFGTQENEKLCAVKSKGTLDITKSDADIYLGKEIIGEISGNWKAKRYTVKIQGNEVASFERYTTTQSIFLGTDTYQLDLKAGVDAVFMVLIAISLDEIYHDYHDLIF